MGSRFPSHQLNNGLYVSGRPEQSKERLPTMSSVAMPYTVVFLGGPSWKVRLGRRDSTTASRAAANTSIPAPTFNLTALVSSFSVHGLSLRNLVALSGTHTIFLAQWIWVLHSDQELFNGNPADSLVKKYAGSTSLIFKDLDKAMVKMGNISPLTRTAGKIN